MIAKLLQSRRFIQILGIVLIAGGLLYAFSYTRGAMNAYRSMRFAMEHNFDAGNPDIDLVSPWMNMRYIGEAYTVPQSFLFEQIGVEMNRPNTELPLGRLNQRYEFGDSDGGGPALVDLVRDAIVAYRADPVVTGLSEGGVRRWMNVTYIANSTGVPVKTFFDALGLPIDGHAYMPLPRLVEETDYQSDVEDVVQILERTIDAHDGVR